MPDWEEDERLEDSLREYVKRRYQRKEVLSFMYRDFPQYQWSVRSLDRRLAHFEIRYIDYNTPLAEIREAVEKEMEGPGRLLGYRALTIKLRQQYNLSVPRDVVYNLMYELNPELIASRAPGVKKKKKRGHFTTKGVNWVHSLDGHDKLMGYQNSTFPLAIYGCIDTASRCLLWLRCWVSNSDPRLPGRWYIEYLLETRTLPHTLRMDRGTETGKLATIHSYLRSMNGDNDPTSSIIYGPSTSNQIERWWRELHERLEGFFKIGLNWLKNHHYYDPNDKNDRNMLAFVMVPIIQRELDIFKDTVWNNHRIRKQSNTLLPDGIPLHIYNFPEEYELEECGATVTKDQIKEAAISSGVLDIGEDFLDAEFRQKCENVIPFPHEVPSKHFKTYIYLKENFV